MKPKVLLLTAPGINCNLETKVAFELAGAMVEEIHINRLKENKGVLSRYQIFVIPGGFTYGDAISSGKILALELRHHLNREIEKFISDGKLILGICNGFQVLVKAGFLGKGMSFTNNLSGRFEARWVKLKNVSEKCIFTKNIKEIELPVAHAEGRIVGDKKRDFNPVFVYTKDGEPTIEFPYNPNGSFRGIAGICDETGRVFGLMPHPERFIFTTQYPRWTKERKEPQGLQIFKNAVEYEANL
jgi:phosphoribosylformylglycinamidine synthase